MFFTAKALPVEKMAVLLYLSVRRAQAGDGALELGLGNGKLLIAAFQRFQAFFRLLLRRL